jgi:hypothetical protein
VSGLGEMQKVMEKFSEEQGTAVWQWLEAFEDGL